jgi:hypothetical protein
MSVTRTGLDQASLIRVGATLTRVYWAAAENYVIGEPFATEADALRETITFRENRATYYREHGARPVAETPVTLELRWQMSLPGSGAVDVAIARTIYETLTDAREHLARIEKYAPKGTRL